MRPFSKKISKLLLVGAVAVATPLVVAPAISYAEKNETLQLLGLFGDVFDKIRSDYVEEPKDKDMIEAEIGRASCRERV